MSTKPKATKASVEEVVGAEDERETIGDHTFLSRPIRVHERALFQRAAAAEARTREGEEDAVPEYMELVTAILNARDPQPEPITIEWLSVQDANEVDDAMYMISTSRGNRKGQQDQS